ncbi:Protein of uncharacterised function (DUF1064) [Urinicoccus massiliensis]|uniref:Protein of uncharacterized function (DUF1064) n=2 Tax=Urinicoccus massiliensis TaxID=1723382 RepID=A0A8H2M6C6_9FIRM|nr:Protein of uncharacterised function (DUF1064) [Urinicoccus massiliensis]
MTYHSKYKAKKAIVDGITFDSKKEAGRYQELKLLERAGAIKDLSLQPNFLLQDKFKYKGKTERKIEYIADFQYYVVKDKRWVIEDVKGYKTDVYKLKRKLFLKQYGEAYEFTEI